MIFEYSCPECKGIYEATQGDLSLNCDRCRKPLQRILSTNFILRGNGWAGKDK
jgi:predicted nucleic acid-binding Zn ribbon protein